MPLVLFLPEVLMMAEKNDPEEAETQRFPECITAQTPGTDYQFPIGSVRKPYTHSSVDRDGLLVRAFFLDIALQECGPATIRVRLPHFCQNSFSEGRSNNFCRFNAMRKKSHCPYMAKHIYETERISCLCTKLRTQNRKQLHATSFSTSAV